MKTYNIIVIDPPWLVNKLVHKSRPNQKEMDYKRMTDEQIANMNISSLADKECWLFLWTTQKFLWKAKNILDGWGFRYILTMVQRYKCLGNAFNVDVVAHILSFIPKDLK